MHETARSNNSGSPDVALVRGMPSPIDYYTNLNLEWQAGTDRALISISESNDQLERDLNAARELVAQQMREICKLTEISEKHRRDNAEMKNLVATLHAELEEERAKAASLREDILMLNSLIRVRREEDQLELSRVCMAHEVEVARMQEEIEISSQRIQEILASNSWRITAPLRAVKRAFLRGID